MVKTDNMLIANNYESPSVVLFVLESEGVVCGSTLEKLGENEGYWG